jgi:hypothetical protein
MSNNKKHLIIIHGRATKPSETEKKRLVKLSLLHGLNRVDTEAADMLKNSNIKYTFVYYGDISNREILRKDPGKKSDLKGKNDANHDLAPCELAGSYDDDLAEMFEYDTFTKKAYKNFLKAVRDKRGLDEAASIVSGIASLIGLSDTVIRKATPDMGAYLMTRKVGSEIRERLQAHLKKALLDNEDICLVSHSMGCIVSYDVLWKFSQMSEYRDIQNSNNKVNLWLTLGNPLGEPGVIDNLYDSNELEDGKYPKNIINRWMNISARDDFVAHDEAVADDFKAMKERKYVNEIKDITNIYNFWAGRDGSNPHKFYGYLDNPTVAKQIAQWILK